MTRASRSSQRRSRRRPGSFLRRRLPALNTDAQPLRFLDFLIRDPEPTVILHGPGIYLHVPAPARYAVHKLIVSDGARKGLQSVTRTSSHELKSAWTEAHARGPK
ncbi:GSU2403 family nucleotidyltransferase fold protein [Bradyrhizobium sp. USDA 4471]